MAYDQWGGDDVKGQFFDYAIKQVVKRNYVLKQLVTVVSANSWINYFYRESTNILSGAVGNTIDGIPRGAEFPQASVEWEKVTTIMKKYGLEENIPWEDIKTDQIAVQQRTAIKIGEAVAYQVDGAIWDGLTENDSPTNAQSFTIAAGYGWDQTSAAIFDDLAHASKLIADYYYPTENLVCVVNAEDKRQMMNYLVDKGTQWNNVAGELVLNGQIGRMAGMRIIESKNCATSRALVLVPKRCAIWKETFPLSTITKEDPYKSTTIRAAEMGVLQLTDPKAVCVICGTDGE